jgi:homoserine O-acetyltransferase
MPDSIPPDSIGIVATKTLHFSEPLELECGKTLSQYDIASETYGEPNAASLRF